METYRDYEGHPIAATNLKEAPNLHAAIQAAVAANKAVIVAGAITSGNGAMSAPNALDDPRERILIKAAPCIEPVLIEEDRLPLHNEVRIIRDENGKITSILSGAAVTPDQLNALLPKNQWIPLDLTTRGQAYVSGVFATGGMGPSRIRPHECIKKVYLDDGHQITELTGEDIKKHQGLLGLTGGIIAIEFEALEVPKEKFAITLPLNVTDENPDWSRELAFIQSQLHKSANFQIQNGKITSQWYDGFLDGMEIITREELEMVIEKGERSEDKKTAQKWLNQMGQSNFLVCITGRTTSTDTLYDDKNPHNPFKIICDLCAQEKVGTPHQVSDLQQMVELRESIPVTAKNEVRRPGENNVAYSTSTDFNLTLTEEAKSADPATLQQYFKLLLSPFVGYEKGFEEIREKAKKLGIEVLMRRYGHGHERDIDLHSRITAIAKSENIDNLRLVEGMIKELKQKLTQAIIQLRTDHPEIVKINPGEKGVPPSAALLTPEELATVRETIATASDHFNWRALGTAVLPTVAQAA